LTAGERGFIAFDASPRSTQLSGLGYGDQIGQREKETIPRHGHRFGTPVAFRISQKFSSADTRNSIAFSRFIAEMRQKATEVGGYRGSEWFWPGQIGRSSQQARWSD
jgi:hypothetical protein